MPHSRSASLLAVFSMSFLGLARAASAQTTAANELEFSTAAYFASSKLADTDDSTSILGIPVRLGYFFSDRLEIEGEVTLTHIFDTVDSTGITSSGRLAFHLGDSSVVPFLFAGGGVGNGVEIGNAAIDTGETRLHWEVGGGIKAFVADPVAIRIDYRFARFTDTIDGFLSNAVNTHRVLVGLSLFTRP